METKQVRLKNIIAPTFYKVHTDIKAGQHSEYWLKGGRGSTKSSFVGIEITQGIMRDKEAHAVIFRKVQDTLRGSVYEQVVWAIFKLGVSDYWEYGYSPLEIRYKPTGQKILFRGLDDPIKIKGIKLRFGRIKYLWFEETTEYSGMEEIRSVKQSVIRGEGKYFAFFTYNPPRSVNNWVNTEVAVPRQDRYVHHSTYLDVPREWLGKEFIAEAEHLKETNHEAYRHEYLGEVTGTGGEVFKNVTLKPITDEEITAFAQLRRGIDWGFASDPFHYAVSNFERRRLYIFFEIHQVELKNRQAAALIKKENKYNMEITCDSAEPKSINELEDLGLNVRGARKGPDSVEFGIKFLQDLDEIVIDSERCPNTAREFTNYELVVDKEGNFKAKYPDKNNHSIDCIRYSLEDDMPRWK